MDKVSNKLKISEYISLSQLKKKFKMHMVEQGYKDFKQSNYPQSIVTVLVMYLEEILSDCLKYVLKHEVNGLYIINNLVVQTTINESSKYDILLKYMKKYNSKIRYMDGVFFNVKKVFDNLESKYGEKLMIESETRNFISYMLLSIQYDITDLSFRIVKYANKRTMNNNVLIAVIGHIMPDDIITKLKLKLDSSSIETNVVEEEEEEDEEEPDEESEEV